MGPLGHPYPDSHPLTPPDTFYFLLFSVDLPHLLRHSTLLFFIPCTLVFPLPFSLRTDCYYTLKMNFSSTVSNLPPFVSNILCHIFCCPIHRVTLPYIFLAILC